MNHPKQILIGISTAVLALALSGCGGGGAVDGKPAEPRKIRGSDIIRASETGATFKGSCQDLQFQGKKYYVETRFTFMNERARDNGLPLYSEQIELFNGPKCKSSHHVGTSIANGDYSFNEDGTRALITYRSFLFTSHRDVFTNSLNNASYCGIGNWETASGKELSKEGTCWSVVQAASYLLSVLEPDGSRLQVYNCVDENASVPTADCMKVKVSRVD